MKRILRMFVVLTSICLLCAACGQTKAGNLRLEETEGTVRIADADGKRIFPKEVTTLSNGYSLETQEDSYAWISMGDGNLVKLDAESKVKIHQEGKDLEIQLSGGRLFFYIPEPLAKGKTLNIRTAAMTADIPGTCGWVTGESQTHSQIFILEGAAPVAGTTSNVTTAAGYVADITVDSDTDTEMTVKRFPVSRIPDFVMAEVTWDEALAAKILEASGLDLLHAANAAELAHEEYANVVAEFRQLPDINVGDEAWWEIDWESYHYVKNGLEFFSPDNAAYAYRDLNGDGVDELFIGEKMDYSWNYTMVALYAFNGTEAVQITKSSFDGGYIFLEDGLFVSCTNGGCADGVYRLNPETCALDPVTDSDIPLLDYDDLDTVTTSNIFSMDFSSHGGRVEESLLDWTPLDSFAP